MNISKVNSLAFKGIVQVRGDINIFHKGEKLQTKEKLAKSGRYLRNLFSGPSVTTNNVDILKGKHIPGSDTMSLYGLVEVDTDRICAITPTDIELRSEDGNTVGFITYNETKDQLRQLLAINAYNTACKKYVSIGIDE